MAPPRVPIRKTAFRTKISRPGRNYTPIQSTGSIDDPHPATDSFHSGPVNAPHRDTERVEAASRRLPSLPHSYAGDEDMSLGYETATGIARPYPCAPPGRLGLAPCGVRRQRGGLSPCDAALSEGAKTRNMPQTAFPNLALRSTSTGL